MFHGMGIGVSWVHYVHFRPHGATKSVKPVMKHGEDSDEVTSWIQVSVMEPHSHHSLLLFPFPNDEPNMVCPRK